MRLTSYLPLLFLVFGNLSPDALALDDPRDLVKKDSPVRSPSRADILARVRIGIHLTEFEKFLVKGKTGLMKESYRPAAKKKHNIRARIEKPNHFYVGKWHIETIPQKWQRATREYTLQIRFSRRYGNGSNMEEVLGTTTVSGKLQGSGYLYGLIANKTVQFNSLNGKPLLAVTIGAPSFQQNVTKKPVSDQKL